MAHFTAPKSNIYDAINKGSVPIESLDSLLNRYPYHINYTAADGSTLLHAAARSGNVEIFKYLVLHTKKKLDPYARTISGQTVLHIACGCGKADMVQHLSEYPELLSGVDNAGLNALFYTSESGNIDIFKYLENKGLSPQTQSKSGMNILFKACWNRHFEFVRFLVENHAYLKNSSDFIDQTALHWTAQGGSVEIFRHLVKEEMDPKALTKSKQTVLHLACWSKKHLMVKFLVGHYPELKFQNDDSGQTPLHWAAQSGSIKIFRLLVTRGLDPQCEDNLGRSVLHVACARNQYDMAKYLVEDYPILKYKTDHEKLTALHVAVQEGNEKIFRYLVDEGFDPYILTKRGETVLHYACKKGMSEMEDLLLLKYTSPESKPQSQSDRDQEFHKFMSDAKKGKDLIQYLAGHPDLSNCGSADGSTVLHAVAESGNVENFRLLVDDPFRLDPRIVTNTGQTVLHRACSGGNYNMVHFVAENYPDLLFEVESSQTSALYSLAESNNDEATQIMSYLVGKGLDPRQTTLSGMTIVHKACYHGRKDMVKTLLKDFEDLKLKNDQIKQTPLHWAAQSGETGLVGYLLDQSLDPYKQTTTGQTILCQAIWKRKLQMVKFLVERYSKLLHITDNQGQTPLHWAARVGDTAIFEYLVAKGLKWASLDEEGKSVLHLACSSKKLDIVQFLLTEYPDVKNKRDRKGRTALHDAVEADAMDIVEHLLSEGFNPSDVSRDMKEKKTVLNVACERGISKLVNVLLREYLNLKQDKVTDDTNEAAFIEDEARNLEEELHRNGDTNSECDTGIGLSQNGSDGSEDERTWSAEIGFLSPSMFRYHIGQNDKTSEEVLTLLQWICARLKSAMPDVAYTWPGYDKSVPKEPIFVAVLKEDHKETAKHVNAIDTFDVVCRKVQDVSEEARTIAEMEIEQGLQFSQGEMSKLHACLAKHTKPLMDRHSNLQIVSASKLKSKRFGTKESEIRPEICIVLYVHVKGVIPFNENPFPEELEGIPTDIREGLYYPHSDPKDYHDSLMMGIKITSSYNTSGTLGGFVELGNGQIGCLSSCHVFESEESMLDLIANPCCHKYFKREVFQPDCSNQSRKFGTVVNACIEPGDTNTIGVDAALIKITDRSREPVNGHFPDATNPNAGFSEDVPLEFNSGQILKGFDEVQRMSNVLKYGCTTQLTRGLLRLNGTSVRRRRFKYYTSPNDVNTLHQQIEIAPEGMSAFSSFGDSGSLVVIASDRGHRYDIRALGLLVGGTSYNRSIVTPIWAILKRFGLPLKLMAFQGFSADRRLDNMESEIGVIGRKLTCLEDKMNENEKNVMDAVGQSKKEIIGVLNNIQGFMGNSKS